MPGSLGPFAPLNVCLRIHLLQEAGHPTSTQIIAALNEKQIGQTQLQKNAILLQFLRSKLCPQVLLIPFSQNLAYLDPKFFALAVVQGTLNAFQGDYCGVFKVILADRRNLMRLEHSETSGRGPDHVRERVRS
nr:hypothetical protein HmN_000703400 [Hymenolepis microstoma]